MPISPELTEKILFTSHHSAPTFTVLLCAVSILPPFGTKTGLQTQWCKLCERNNLETRFGRKNSRPALLLWLLAAGPRVRTAPPSAMGRESPAPAGAPCRKWWHRRKRPRTKAGKGMVRSVRYARSHCRAHTPPGTLKQSSCTLSSPCVFCVAHLWGFLLPLYCFNCFSRSHGTSWCLLCVLAFASFLAFFPPLFLFSWNTSKLMKTWCFLVGFIAFFVV